MDGGWNLLFIRHRYTADLHRLKVCCLLFHRKGRKDRKDIVTLTLRSLRCSISFIIYFNSHSATPAPHFLNPRSAHEHPHPVHSARDLRAGKCRKGSTGEWRRAGGGRAMGRIGAGNRLI